MLSKNVKIGILLFTILLSIVSIIVYSESVNKKKQLNKKESLEKGYGYYTEEVSLGCKTNSCAELGKETFVQKCIINQRTGKYCINKDGEYSTESVYRIQPCRTQCYSTQLSNYTGYETKKTQSVSLNNEVTEYNQVLGDQNSLIYITNKKNGLDYTSYFLNKEKTNLRNPELCIKDEFTIYTKNIIESFSTGTVGTKESEVKCSSYTESNTLRMKGSLLENYPEEDNINGIGNKKVCYDINNYNQIEILNTPNDTPENFVFPELCYKHSQFLDFPMETPLWPDKKAVNRFDIHSEFLKDTQYFSFIDTDKTSRLFNENVIDRTYSLQKDINSYSKVLLNSEITLLDKVYEQGSCYLEDSSFKNNIYYMKGVSLTDNPGISGVSGYLGGTGKLNIIPVGGTCYFYPFEQNTEGMEKISSPDSNFYYFNTENGTSEYIYIENSNNIVPAINYDWPFYINSDKFLGIPFNLDVGVGQPLHDNSVIRIIRDSHIDMFEGILLSNSQSYKDEMIKFNNLYRFHPSDSEMSPREVLFTNNCFMTGTSFPGNLSSQIAVSNETEYQIKNHLSTIESSDPFYVYGTLPGTSELLYHYPISLEGPAGFYEYPISFLQYSEFTFYTSRNSTSTKNYIEDEYSYLPDFSDISGTASVKLTTRKSYGVSGIDIITYPSDLKIINQGSGYSIGSSCTLYNMINNNGINFNTPLELSIGVCIITPIDESIQGIKILRNGSPGVCYNLDQEGVCYKIKKLSEYYSMIQNQGSTKSLQEKSEIILFPQYSLSKVFDSEIFKSPYIETDNKKDYVCFDEKNSYDVNKKITLNPGDKLINYTSGISEGGYFGKNVIRCKGELGVNYDGEFFPPQQFRERSGINYAIGCSEDDVIKTTSYSNFGDFLQPCIAGLSAVVKVEGDKVFKSFYTRQKEDDKIYSVDEDIFTNYDERNYFIKTENNTKERVYFYENSVEVYQNQLFGEVFGNDFVGSSINNNLGPDNVYNNNIVSDNYSKKIIYEVTSGGFLPESPANRGIDFYHGHYFDTPGITDSDIKESYSNLLERSSNYFDSVANINNNFGLWTDLKLTQGVSYSDTLKINSPVLNLFGFNVNVVNGNEIWNFSSRLYDNNLQTPWNDIQIGDYVTPNFNYFNKFFMPIFESKDTYGNKSIINDLITGIINVGSSSGTSVTLTITPKNGFIKGDYVLFIKPDPYKDYMGTCYPSFEIGRISDKTGTDLLSVTRNINNTDLNFLPNISTGVSLFNLGNNYVDNNIINNYYKITDITDDKKGSRYMEFVFQIPSISGTSIMIGTSTTNDLSFFINKITRNPTIYQTTDAESTNIFNKYIPSLSCNYIKNNITFPQSENCAVFSNQEKSKMNTRMLSYATAINYIGTSNIYLNEFREDSTLFDKQIPLTFKKGDTIKYWNNTGSGTSLNYKNSMTLEINTTNCLYSVGASSFQLFDYGCSIISGSFVPPSNTYPELGGGTSPVYQNFTGTSFYSIPYNSFEGGAIDSKGISSFYFSPGITGSGMSIIFEGGGNSSYGYGTSFFMDYYKLKDLNFTSLISNNKFPYQSFFIRSGNLDVLQLDSTILKSQEGNNTIVLSNIEVTGKPYGSSFLLSEPNTSQGVSNRVNFTGYSNIKSFTSPASNNTEEIYTSGNGLVVRTFSNKKNIASLKFKTIENIKDTEFTNLGDNIINNLEYTNYSTDQFFENTSGVSSKFSSKNWEVEPYTLYPKQNYITARVGNIYYNDDILLNPLSNIIYKVTGDSIQLSVDWTTSPLVEILDMKNFLTNNDNKFYTLAEKDGISSFLKNYKNIENASNLDDKSLSILIKTYNDKTKGKFPVISSYHNPDFEIDILKSYIENTNLKGLPIFKDFRMLQLNNSLGERNKMFSLGFTPVIKSNTKINNIKILQDNFNRNSQTLSQYIYSIDIDETNPRLRYGMNKCISTGGGFSIGTTEVSGVNKFQFANSLLFNFTPCKIGSQDHIPYDYNPGLSGTSIVSFQGTSSFPVTFNYFPTAGVTGSSSAVIGTSSATTDVGTSYIGVSFSSNYTTFPSKKQTISKNIDYVLKTETGVLMPDMNFKIKETSFNIFEYDSVAGSSNSIISNSSGFSYGDYWYIENKSKEIKTFGFIVPEPGGSIRTHSFIQLKDLKEPLTDNVVLKFITKNNHFGGDFLQNKLNKSASRNEKNKIDNYEITGEVLDSSINSYMVWTPDPGGVSQFYINLEYYNGSSLPIKYNEAIVKTNNVFQSDTFKIYLPISEDFYKYSKCKAICMFGSGYLGKLKYNLDKSDQILSLKEEEYSPLIFEPYKIDTFVEAGRKFQTKLATGTSVIALGNIQDTFLISREGGTDKIDLICNPFSDSIMSNYCNFSKEAFLGNGTSNIPKKLGVIDSQSTTVLITLGCSGVSAVTGGVSVKNVVTTNTTYTPGVCVPGPTNYNLELSEIRQNTKNYFQNPANDCSIYFEKDVTHLPVDLGGLLNFDYSNNSFEIVDGANLIRIEGTSFSIAKNLQYFVTQTGNNGGNQNILFGTSSTNIFKKDRTFSGTSSLEIGFFKNNFQTEMEYNDYITTPGISAEIKILFKDSYSVGTSQTFYYGNLEPNNIWKEMNVISNT